MIFSLAILTTFGAFNFSLRVANNAKNLTVAANLAQGEVEKIRELSFQGLSINTNPSPQPTDKLPGGFVKVYVDYFMGDTKIKIVTVKVYWNDRPESNALTAVTLVSEGGVTN